MKNAEEFRNWRIERASELANDDSFTKTSLTWIDEAIRMDYSYMFEWFGVPTIQFPADLLLIQEAIFKSKPNVVIEIGIARGGTTLFLATIMKAIATNSSFSVIGVDISISEHTRQSIETTEYSSAICLIEGNSISIETFEKIKNCISPSDKVLVILDSNHTKDHVLSEMELYSSLVSKDSYLIVMDTAIEYISPKSIPSNRPWSRGNSPLSAVEEFVARNSRYYQLDYDLNNRSLPGAAKGGYLRKLH